MHSFAPRFLGRLVHPTEDLASIGAIAEARGRQQLYMDRKPEVLESLRQVAVIESSESSNRLEGITAPRERIERLVTASTTPKDRSEQEIAGYRDALDLIHQAHREVGGTQRVSSPMPFSVNVLLQLHACLYRYQPGQGGHFKDVENEIVERAPDGRVLRVRFRPTPAIETPGAMADLVRGHRDAIDHQHVHPLVAMPLAVLDLLCIHPFLDGNGRVGRLTMLLLLYRHGYAVGRYISLERVIEESKQTYYETLATSSHGWHQGQHDPHPWLRYVWGVLMKANKEFEERVGTLAAEPPNKSEQVRATILRRVGPFTSTHIERDCPTVSPELVRLVLRQMRDEGVIRLTGRGRGAKWVRADLG